MPASRSPISRSPRPRPSCCFPRSRPTICCSKSGLGGRFDATNVVDHPLGTIITPVSIDHVEFLGSDLAGIAREKAGILKRGSPAVVARQQDEALDVIEDEAAKLGVTPFVGGQDFDGYRPTRTADLSGRGRPSRPAGAGACRPVPVRQCRPSPSRRPGISACRSARPISPRGLRTVDWPARMQPLRTGKLRALLPEGHELWLDGGHNEAGGAVVADGVRALQARTSASARHDHGHFRQQGRARLPQPFRRTGPQAAHRPHPGRTRLMDGAAACRHGRRDRP